MPLRPLRLAVTWLSTMPVEARVILIPSTPLSCESTDDRVLFVTYRCSTSPSMREFSMLESDMTIPSALVRNRPYAFPSNSVCWIFADTKLYEPAAVLSPGVVPSTAPVGSRLVPKTSFVVRRVLAAWVPDAVSSVERSVPVSETPPVVPLQNPRSRNAA
jgi:hypothetical protein